MNYLSRAIHFIFAASLAVYVAQEYLNATSPELAGFAPLIAVNAALTVAVVLILWAAIIGVLRLVQRAFA